MKLYVIRHGESENNLNKHYTGWAQPALTPKGIEDAKAIRPLLAQVPFDRIYASDLLRAKQTAETALPGCTYEELPLLREIHVGTLAGKPFTVLTDEQRQKNAAIGFAEYGGESRETFNNRVCAFLKKMESVEGNCIAAFAHAGFLRGLLDEVVGTVLSRNRVCCSNCTVAIFEYQEGKWSLHSWINPL